MTNGNKKVTNRGIAFEFGDDWLIIPELTLDQAQELAEKIDVVQEPVPPYPENAALFESRELFLTAIREHKAAMRLRQDAAKIVIKTALQNNYPNISDGDLKRFITVRGWTSMFNAAVGFGDGKKVKDLGELEPVVAGPILTGNTSTGA